MARLKVLVAFLIGIALGVAMTFRLAERATRFAFEARTEIVLADAKGKEVGRIPAGAALFSPDQPDGADVGFQAYLPIWLGTGSEAKTLIASTTTTSARSKAISMNGVPRSALVHPQEGP
jgi:hypothetical protein